MMASKDDHSEVDKERNRREASFHGSRYGILWEVTLRQLLARQRGSVFAQNFVVHGLHGIAHLLTPKKIWALRAHSDPAEWGGEPVPVRVSNNATKLANYILSADLHSLLAETLLKSRLTEVHGYDKIIRGLNMLRSAITSTEASWENDVVLKLRSMGLLDESENFETVQEEGWMETAQTRFSTKLRDLNLDDLRSTFIERTVRHRSGMASKLLELGKELSKKESAHAKMLDIEATHWPSKASSSSAKQRSSKFFDYVDDIDQRIALWSDVMKKMKMSQRLKNVLELLQKRNSGKLKFNRNNKNKKDKGISKDESEEKEMSLALKAYHECLQTKREATVRINRMLTDDGGLGLACLVQGALRLLAAGRGEAKSKEGKEKADKAAAALAKKATQLAQKTHTFRWDNTELEVDIRGTVDFAGKRVDAITIGEIKSTHNSLQNGEQQLLLTLACLHMASWVLGGGHENKNIEARPPRLTGILYIPKDVAHRYPDWTIEFGGGRDGPPAADYSVVLRVVN